MAETKTSGRLDPEWECPCGRFKTDWPASKAKHLMACDGTPPALSGRIAQPSAAPASRKRGHADRTPPAAKRRAKKARRSVPPRKAAKRPARRHATTAKRRSAVAAASTEAASTISPATFLSALRAERAKIDAAIAAVEALA